MGFFVYILRCADGSFYVGHTDNLEERIAAHAIGSVPGYTAAPSRRPGRLEFSSEFPTRLDALERERQIKRWTRKKKEALISGDWDQLRALAMNRTKKRAVRPEPVEGRTAPENALAPVRPFDCAQKGALRTNG